MIIIDLIRYIFLTLILSGCTSIGFLISKKYIYREEELNSIFTSITLLKNKINFTHKPLSEIFYELSKCNENVNISKIFYETSEKIKNNSFKEAWEEAINNQETSLKQEDINIIKTLGNTLGKNDILGEINELETYIYILKKQIKKAEEERKKNEKMYKSLGTIIGLAIVIILF